MADDALLRALAGLVCAGRDWNRVDANVYAERAATGCPVVKASAVDYKGVPYEYDAQGESPEYTAFIGDEEWDEGIAP